VGGVPLQEALDDLQPFALAIRGQVDLRQRDVRVLGARVLLEEPLQEADRVVGPAPVDEDECHIVRGFTVARAFLQRLPEVGLRAVQLALPPEDEAEIVQGLGEVGCGVEGRPEPLDRRRQLAVLRQEGAQVVAGLG
jgi:hypothetical protein